MDAATTQFLLDKYKPIFYLFSKEKYKPSSFETILQNSNLVENAKVILDSDGKETIERGNVTVSAPNVTSALLYDLSKGKYKGETGLKTLYLDFPESLIYGTNDVSKVPIYGLVRQRSPDTIEISYILNFPYNGPFNVLNAQKTGVHNGDLEHVTLLVKAPTDGSFDNIEQVMFGAHGSADGRWVSKKDLITEDGRVVVFVADHSHALYPKPGMVFRLGGVANDYTDKGTRWDAPYVQPLYFDNDPNFNKDVMGWIYFSGRIGYDGISSLVDKYWFAQGEPLPGTKKLSAPPIISYGQAKLYYILIAGLICAISFGIIKFGFWQKRIDPDIYFAIIVALFIIGYDRLKYIIKVVS